MNYADFKQSIIEMLLEDGAIHGTESYLERHIRVALLEALSYFPSLRPDKTLVVTPEDVSPEGKSCSASIPVGVTINEIRLMPTGWLYTDTNARTAVTDGLSGFDAWDFSDGQAFTIVNAGTSGLPKDKVLYAQDINGRFIPHLDGNALQQNIKLELL